MCKDGQLSFWQQYSMGSYRNKANHLGSSGFVNVAIQVLSGSKQRNWSWVEDFVLPSKKQCTYDKMVSFWRQFYFCTGLVQAIIKKYLQLLITTCTLALCTHIICTTVRSDLYPSFSFVQKVQIDSTQITNIPRPDLRLSVSGYLLLCSRSPVIGYCYAMNMNLSLLLRILQIAEREFKSALKTV